MHMLNWFKEHERVIVRTLLVLLLCVAAFIRVQNIDRVKNVDEPNIIKRAVKVADGQLHIQWYNWPAQSLIRLDGIVFRSEQLIMSIRDEEWRQPVGVLYKQHPLFFNTTAHLITVLFSLIGTVFVYLITKRLTRSRWAGLLAALFLSCGYLFTLHSRFATPDVPVATLFLVNMYLALRLLDEQDTKKQRRLYILAGAVTGFAIATKYTGALALLPVAYVHVLKFCQTHAWKWKQMFKKIHHLLSLSVLLFGVFVLIVHTIWNPFFFADIQGIIKQILFEAKPQRIGVDWAGKDFVFFRNMWLYVKGSLAWNGSIITIIGYATIIYSVTQIKKSSWLPVSVVTLFYFVTLFGISKLGLHWSRWAIPFSPLIAIMAAVGITAVVRSIPKKNTLPKIITAICTAFIILVAIFPQLLVSIVTVHSYNYTSTTAVLRTYIHNHVPQQVSIVSDTYYLSLGKQYRVSEPRFTLYKESVDDYRAGGVDYLIVKPNRLSNARKQPDVYPYIIDFFNDLEETATLLHTASIQADTLLHHKRDYGVYKWIFQNGFSHIFEIPKGATLQLYRL